MGRGSVREGNARDERDERGQVRSVIAVGEAVGFLVKQATGIIGVLREPVEKAASGGVVPFSTLQLRQRVRAKRVLGQAGEYEDTRCAASGGL